MTEGPAHELPSRGRGRTPARTRLLLVVHLAIPGLLMAGAGCRGPESDAPDPPVRTEITLDVLDSESEERVTGEIEVYHAGLRPIFTGLTETVAAETLPYTIAQSLGSDSMEVEVRVRASGYGNWRTTVWAQRGASDTVEASLQRLEEPRPATPRQPPLPTQPATRIVIFTTNPPGATVRLTLLGPDPVDQPEFTTPTTLELPRGVYSWRITRAQYLPEESGVRPLDVSDVGAPVSFDRTLRPEPGDMIRRGDLVYPQDCPTAIALYERAERPADPTTTQAADYTRSRYRLGDCYDREEEYEDALEAFQEALDFNPATVEARLRIGSIQCENADYLIGKRAIRDIESWLPQVRSNRRRAIVALARYETAQCLEKEYRASRVGLESPLRTSAIATYQEFVQLADRVLDDAIAPATEMDEVARTLELANRALANLIGQ